VLPSDPSINWRIAHDSDGPSIATVHCASALAGFANIFPPTAPKPTPKSLEEGWYRLLTDPCAEVIVALTINEIIGVVAVSPCQTVPTGTLLDRLYVDPPWWGCGVGGLLHDVAVDRARDRSAGGLNLWVLEANSRARQIYERRRWQLIPGRTQSGGYASVAEVLYELRPESIG